MNLNRSINISLRDVTGTDKRFDNLRVYLRFLKSEASFWGKHKERLAEFNRTHTFLNFSANLDQVIQAIDSQKSIDDFDDPKLNQVILNLQRSHLAHSSSHWLWSGHDFTPKFIEVLENNSSEASDSFLSYLVKGQLQNLAQRRYLEGAILAYEFHHQNSDLTKRRKSERATISKLRDDLENANQELITETNATKDEFYEWYRSARDNYSGWKTDLEHRAERLYDVNKYLAERKGASYDRAVTKQFKTWSERFEELEHTFKEKIRLEKPAEYWRKTADKLRLQGVVFTLFTVLIAALGIWGVMDLFVKWLLKEEQIINLASIQGAVLFASLAAIYAFVVRVLSRLAFSSFHLMRDAEEREQLTYLYLSLSEDAEVDKESRNIVLQALFSRSETGLLGQDSGPTMPGAGDLLKGFSKSK